MNKSIEIIEEFKNGKIKQNEPKDTAYLARGLEEGTIQYYQAIFPMIFDKQEDYQIFVDFYNDFYEKHPELKPKKINEIDYLLSVMKVGYENNNNNNNNNNDLI